MISPLISIKASLAFEISSALISLSPYFPSPTIPLRASYVFCNASVFSTLMPFPETITSTISLISSSCCDLDTSYFSGKPIVVAEISCCDSLFVVEGETVFNSCSTITLFIVFTALSNASLIGMSNSCCVFGSALLYISTTASTHAIAPPNGADDAITGAGGVITAGAGCDCTVLALSFPTSLFNIVSTSDVMLSNFPASAPCNRP
mmetsp:Transcript_12312/g.15213  ORF Transcript_12312/g.15213 Transcript_12312/m.15213 type:complete len:206 (-) Transcript_12312:1511-2128(-)